MCCIVRAPYDFLTFHDWTSPPSAGVKDISNFPGPGAMKSVALYWSPNACRPTTIGLVQPGRSNGRKKQKTAVTIRQIQYHGIETLTHRQALHFHRNKERVRPMNRVAFGAAEFRPINVVELTAGVFATIYQNRYTSTTTYHQPVHPSYLHR